MPVMAAMWFESPGAKAENKEYADVDAVCEDFDTMVDTWNRIGGSKPVCVIYAHDHTDYPLYTLEVTDRGAVKQTTA